MQRLLNCPGKTGVTLGCCDEPYEYIVPDCVRVCLIREVNKITIKHFGDIAKSMKYGLSKKCDNSLIAIQDLQSLVNLLSEVFARRSRLVATGEDDISMDEIWSSNNLSCVRDYFEHKYDVDVEDLFLKAAIYDPSNPPGQELLSTLPVPSEEPCTPLIVPPAIYPPVPPPPPPPFNPCEIEVVGNFDAYGDFADVFFGDFDSYYVSSDNLDIGGFYGAVPGTLFSTSLGFIPIGFVSVGEVMQEESTGDLYIIGPGQENVNLLFPAVNVDLGLNAFFYFDTPNNALLDARQIIVEISYDNGVSWEIVYQGFAAGIAGGLNLDVVLEGMTNVQVTFEEFSCEYGPFEGEVNSECLLIPELIIAGIDDGSSCFCIFPDGVEDGDVLIATDDIYFCGIPLGSLVTVFPDSDPCFTVAAEMPIGTLFSIDGVFYYYLGGGAYQPFLPDLIADLDNPASVFLADGYVTAGDVRVITIETSSDGINWDVLFTGTIDVFGIGLLLADIDFFFIRYSITMPDDCVYQYFDGQVLAPIPRYLMFLVAPSTTLLSTGSNPQAVLSDFLEDPSPWPILGSTWETETGAPFFNRMSRMSITPDGSSLVVIGSGTRSIMASVDSGATWVGPSIGFGNNTIAIDCHYGGSGVFWVVGVGVPGTRWVAKSLDGGNTWISYNDFTDLVLPVGGQWSAVVGTELPDSAVGIIRAAENEIIVRTSDGGINWSAVATYSQLFELHLLSSGRILAFSTADLATTSLAISDDTGSTFYEPVEQPPGINQVNGGLIHCSSIGSNVYSAGGFRSINNGNTWLSRPPGWPVDAFNNSIFKRIKAIDIFVLTAISVDGSFWISRDGGQNWEISYEAGVDPAPESDHYFFDLEGIPV